MNPKLIRLKNGEDIIADTLNEVDPELIKLLYPMSILFKYDQKSGTSLMVIDNWIPPELVEKPEVVINKTDLLFMIEPSNDFNDYYVKSVDVVKKKIEQRKTAKEILKNSSEEELNELMDQIPVSNKELH